MKKVTIRIDGDKVDVETEGFAGMSCHDELKALNLPFDTVRESPQPSRGVAVGQSTKVRVG